MQYMRNFKALIHLVLLLTFPSLALYPHINSPWISLQTEQDIDCNNTSPWIQNDYLFSYDKILTLLDEIESGKLEQQCSEEDLERLNYFLANLAQEGVL